MINRAFAALATLALLSSCAPTGPAAPRLASDAAIDAAESEPVSSFAKEGRWNDPMSPFTVYGNIHYVGTHGVSAWLITSPKGHVLIDGILAQSVPQIIANIRTLGFDIRDVRYLLNSHAHIDHAGGLAGLQRASKATMIASAADKPILEAGRISFGPSATMPFPAVRVDRTINDGDHVRVGGIDMTAHITPGHSPGCTSWSMATTGKDGAKRTAFFHCSATVAGQALVPESWPGMVVAYRQTFARVEQMRADIFLANHDNFFNLHQKRARLQAADANAFVDPGELRRFNTTMEKAFNAELSRQKAGG